MKLIKNYFPFLSIINDVRNCSSINLYLPLQIEIIGNLLFLYTHIFFVIFYYIKFIIYCQLCTFAFERYDYNDYQIEFYFIIIILKHE